MASGWTAAVGRSAWACLTEHWAIETLSVPAEHGMQAFVVDFARLLELLHDAPDKVGISEAGVRQKEWEMLAGGASPGRVPDLPFIEWKMESSWLKDAEGPNVIGAACSGSGWCWCVPGGEAEGRPAREKASEYTVRGAGVRGRKARCGPGRVGAAFVAAREPMMGVGARVARVLKAGALGRRPSCGRRGGRGAGVAGGGGCTGLPRVGKPTARELRAPA